MNTRTRPELIQNMRDRMAEIDRAVMMFRDGLLQTNNPDYQRFFASLLNRIVTIIENERQGMVLTLADDLSTVRSALRRLPIADMDPDLDDVATPSILRLRGERGNLVDALDNALDAARTLRLEPRLVDIEEVQVERRTIAKLLQALDKRLSASQDAVESLRSAVIDSDAQGSNAVSQQGLLNVHIRSLGVEISAARFETNPAFDSDPGSRTDITALARAVGAMHDIVDDLREMVHGLDQWIVGRVKAAGLKVVQTVTRSWKGMKVVVRSVSRALTAQEAANKMTIDRSMGVDVHADAIRIDANLSEDQAPAKRETLDISAASGQVDRASELSPAQAGGGVSSDPRGTSQYVHNSSQLGGAVREAHAEATRTAAEDARMAAEAAAAIGRRFPNDVALLQEVAIARRNEAFAWCKVPAGGQATSARAAADIVADIAINFPNEIVFQRESATARRHEGFAWSQVPAGARAAEVRAVAETIAAICERFPEDAHLQREAATARRLEAIAWAKVPTGLQAAASRAAADIVAEFGKHLPNDLFIQREIATARRHEGFAWCQVPLGAQAALAHAAAEMVSAIAERFPDDVSLSREAVYARRHEASAWSQVPAGAQAAAARAAAEAAAAVGERAPDDVELQRELAMTWRHAAFACSLVPAGAQAPAVSIAVEAVKAIGTRFPEDIAIQREVVYSLRHSTYALGQVPV